VAAYLTWIAATKAKMYGKTASRAVYNSDTNRSQLSNPTYVESRPHIDYANIQPKITPDRLKMTQKQKLTLEKLDEEARKRLGELKKAGADASIQLKENLGDLKKYTDSAARRLSDGGSKVGDRAKKGWTELISRAREAQSSLQESVEKRRKE